MTRTRIPRAATMAAIRAVAAVAFAAIVVGELGRAAWLSFRGRPIA